MLHFLDDRKTPVVSPRENAARSVHHFLSFPSLHTNGDHKQANILFHDPTRTHPSPPHERYPSRQPRALLASSTPASTSPSPPCRSHASPSLLPRVATTEDFGKPARAYVLRSESHLGLPARHPRPPFPRKRVLSPSKAERKTRASSATPGLLCHPIDRNSSGIGATQVRTMNLFPSSPANVRHSAFLTRIESL